MILLLALALSGSATNPIPTPVRSAYMDAWTALFAVAYCDRPADDIRKERLRQSLIASFYRLEERYGEAATVLQTEWERRVWVGPAVACGGQRGFARARAAAARLKRLTQR